MKRIEDIENLSIEELERIAEDSSLPSLGAEAVSRLEDSLACAAELERLEAERSARQSKRIWPLVFAPIAMACVIALAVVGYNNRTPVDTFTDPVQAYAAVQTVFERMNEKTAPAFEMARTNTQKLERPAEVMSNMNIIKVK